MAESAPISGPSSLAGTTLRGYARSDLEAMFQLDTLCFKEPFRFSKADMRRFAEARKAQVIIADRGHELAGFSITHAERIEGQAEAYLLTLDVAPALRRHGLGRLLIAAAERGACNAGLVAMRLHVSSGNAGAIALYEKLGYTRLGKAENFYGDGLHAWVYRKALAAPHCLPAFKA